MAAFESSDVSGLLLADPDAHRLVELAKDAKVEFCRDHDVTKAIRQFRQLAEAYHGLMSSSVAGCTPRQTPTGGARHRLPGKG